MAQINNADQKRSLLGAKLPGKSFLDNDGIAVGLGNVAHRGSGGRFGVMRRNVAEARETLERELAKSRESGFITGETYEKARLEALRSAMESAKDTIKSCILINGGAAGALLVFMGHLASVRDERLIRALAGSLRWFMAGLIAGIVAHWMAYASNLNFSRDPPAANIEDVEGLQKISSSANCSIDLLLRVWRIFRVSCVPRDCSSPPNTENGAH